MPRIEVTTLVSHRTGDPRIEVYSGKKGRDRFQLSVAEARDLALNLIAGCESAIQDAFMADFVRLKLEGDDKMVASLLTEFRNMRRDRQNDPTA